MQARGASLVVGGLGLFTFLMLATPDSVGWVFMAWILVAVSVGAVGTGLALVARSHAAMTGALPSEDVRPPPWPAPDPIYTWPGPRLLGGEILELGDGGPIPVGAVTVPESAPAAEPQPPAPERAPQVPWWRRSARTAVAAGLAGALLARVTDGERLSSGPAGQ